jgi:hypothetical protein
MPDLVVTSGQFVSFAHRILWECAQRQLKIAEQCPADSWMLHLSAGLLSAAAFEAYLNYLGGEMLPQVWAQERSFFSQPEYRGTSGKLKRITEELGYLLPPNTHQPYRAWLDLVQLRDRIVHAKPKKKDYRVLHQQSRLPRTQVMWLYPEAKEARIASLISHTQKFATELHTLVKNSEFRFVIFGGHPFLGALGFGGGTTSVA